MATTLSPVRKALRYARPSGLISEMVIGSQRSASEPSTSPSCELCNGLRIATLSSRIASQCTTAAM
eukprot:scaffold126971_cov48-Phaeocystis_antarctica.AAC.2